MDRKWTPGPWRVEYSHGETKLIMGDGDCHMCDMTYYPWVPDNDADWHLIAAAPDLYEALAEILCTVSYHDIHPATYYNARAALSKARGEA